VGRCGRYVEGGDLNDITWVTGDLAKPETLPTAFKGAKTLFLVSSIGEDTVALQHNAIEAARNAGMTHIVKLSAFGASGHSTAPICLWHYQVEKEMQESGMDWTIHRQDHRRLTPPLSAIVYRRTPGRLNIPGVSRATRKLGPSNQLYRPRALPRTLGPILMRQPCNLIQPESAPPCLQPALRVSRGSIAAELGENLPALPLWEPRDPFVLLSRF